MMTLFAMPKANIGVTVLPALVDPQAEVVVSGDSLRKRLVKSYKLDFLS